MPAYICPECGQSGFLEIGNESFYDWARKKFGPNHGFTSDRPVSLECWRCSQGSAPQVLVTKPIPPPAPVLTPSKKENLLQKLREQALKLKQKQEQQKPKPKPNFDYGYDDDL